MIWYQRAVFHYWWVVNLEIDIDIQICILESHVSNFEYFLVVSWTETLKLNRISIRLWTWHWWHNFLGSLSSIFESKPFFGGKSWNAVKFLPFFNLDINNLRSHILRSVLPYFNLDTDNLSSKWYWILDTWILITLVLSVISLISKLSYTERLLILLLLGGFCVRAIQHVMLFVHLNLHVSFISLIVIPLLSNCFPTKNWRKVEVPKVDLVCISTI